MKKIGTLSKAVKILLCLGICALLLFFWWALLRFPALTPSGCFKAYMQDSLIAGVEEKTVIKVAGSRAIVLGEANGAIYSLAVGRYGTNLYWTPGMLKVTPLTDGAYIVPLARVYISGAKELAAAVKAEGSRAELDLVLGDTTYALIQAGEQDGWFLFRYEEEKAAEPIDYDAQGSDSRRENSEDPEMFLQFADRGAYLSGADPTELRLRVYDSQNRLIREVVRSFPSDKME
ncbi:MAG: hypothetical protein J5496_03395 [Lachnospiraceae bacterium]|nr:hypothetical protein [Lachnospiraceae bacterium]